MPTSIDSDDPINWRAAAPGPGHHGTTHRQIGFDVSPDPGVEARIDGGDYQPVPVLFRDQARTDDHDIGFRGQQSGG